MQIVKLSSREVIMLVVIIILKLKTLCVESFMLAFQTIRLVKTLTAGSLRTNEVEDIIHHEMDPPIGVSIDFLRVPSQGCD